MTENLLVLAHDTSASEEEKVTREINEVPPPSNEEDIEVEDELLLRWTVKNRAEV